MRLPDLCALVLLAVLAGVPALAQPDGAAAPVGTAALADTAAVRDTSIEILSPTYHARRDGSSTVTDVAPPPEPSALPEEKPPPFLRGRSGDGSGEGTGA